MQKGAEGCRQRRVPVVGGRPHAKTTAGLQDDRAASHAAEVSEKAPVLRPRFECWIRCLLFLPVRRLFLRKQKSGPRQLSPEGLKSDGSGGFRVQGSAGSPSIFPCFCFRGSLGRPRLWRQLPRRHRSQQLDPCFPASPDLPRSGKEQSSDSSLRQAEPLKTPEPAEAMTDVWQHVGLSLSWLHLCMSLAAQPSAAAKFPALICRRQHRVPVVGGRPHAKTTAGLQDDRAASHAAEVSEKAPVLRPRFECWIRCLLFLPVRRLFLRKQKSGPRQLSPEALKSDESGGFRVQGSAGSPSIFPCFCFRGSLGRPRLWRQLPRRHRSQQLDPCFPASPDLPRSGKEQSSDSSLRQAEPLKTPEPAEAMTDV